MFMNDEYSMQAIGINEVTVNRGDSTVLIAGAMKTFTIQSQGIHLGSFYFAETEKQCIHENAVENRFYNVNNMNSANVLMAGCHQDMI